MDFIIKGERTLCQGKEKGDKNGRGHGCKRACDQVLGWLEGGMLDMFTERDKQSVTSICCRLLLFMYTYLQFV